MLKKIEYLSRFGIFATFLGHGIFAFNINTKWIPLITCFGFSKKFAVEVMPFIGILDIIVAFIVLLYPLRIIVFWAFFWAFITALSRPISGDSIFEFVERASNWGLPLILFFIMNHKYKNTELSKNIL
jgi:hypothetical protein